MSIIIAIILALAVGGGVSVAAENARPGNALYGFKVGVNEEVRAALALGAKADAVWDLRRAERRLEEAENLAVKGNLSAEASANLEARFLEFADRAEARVNKLAETDARAAADLAANFSTALDAHAAILDRLAANASGVARAEMNAMARVVREERDDADAAEASAEAKVTAGADVEAAAHGRLGAAENKIAEVRAFIENVSARVSAEAKASAEAKLAAASQSVADGKTKLDAGMFAAAFNLFGDAHEMAQEAKLMLEVNQSLDLNIDLGGRNESAPNASVTGTERSEGRLDLNLGL